MFCSKCGSHLPDDAKFCGACGAPVNTAQEDFHVPQQPTSIPNETENIQAPKSEPFMEAQNFGAQMRDGVTVSGKKSKKGLVIGLSLGGVLLAVILTVTLIFVFGQKGSSKGNGGSVPLGYSAVVYDDQYTYFLSRTEDDKACIKRVGNDLQGKPEILYEAEEIKGDGWSKYPMGCMFLWNDKICFIEFTSATAQGDDEYEIHWISKDGKEDGILVSYEDFIGYARSLYRDDFLPLMENIYFYEDYLIFSDSYSFCQVNLNTGVMFECDTLLSIQGPACFAAYHDGYYYYFVPDMENNRMGDTLYRIYSDIEEGVLGEAEKIGKVPSQDDDVDTYFSFIPKGDYLYYADLDNIYRLNIEDGSTENLTSYEGTYNRFTLCENGLYFYKDRTLRFLNTETLEETVFDEIERIPSMIYAGADDACWIQGDATSPRYHCFLPDKQGGSFIYFGESDQTASAEDQEAVNTTELYADVVNQTIAEHGALGFQETQFDCIARGVFKIDLLDFNQDGTDELLILYSNESDSVFPVIEVWTIKNGEAAQVFSGKSRVESQEPIFGFNLYQSAGNLYVPVYDSLDCNPIYVHLYGFDNNGEFRDIFQYENNAFYMNQLPDGMEFTDYDNILFGVDSLRDDFEGDKNAMKETLQADMADTLNKLGITVPENSQEDAISTYDYEGDWVWKRENSDMEASLHLDATDEAALSGTFSAYRLFSEPLTITVSGDAWVVTSETGNWCGTAEFGADYIILRFEDVPVLGFSSISEGFGTTEFQFTPAN